MTNTAEIFRQVKRNARTTLDACLLPIRIGCNPNSARYRKLERRIRRYVLPEALTTLEGRLVNDANTWTQKRRLEILNLFKVHIYGNLSATPSVVKCEVTAIETHALQDFAIRKEVDLAFGEKGDGSSMKLLMYLPKRFTREKAKVPIFLGLNFFGNHTIHPDPGISIPSRWIPNNSITDGRSPHALRGLQRSSWPVESILERGYGLVTAYCGEIFPDRRDGWRMSLGAQGLEETGGIGPRRRCGAIGVWAWGLSKAMDYLEHDSEVDAQRVLVIGHSRLGKAALWAGAQDPRFAMVISNQSGCGGAALSRRRFGETVAQINSSFPHWFCDRFKDYNDNEDALPIDQHQLIALIAPRPVCVSNAQHDLHADPMGQFHACRAASAVYELFGVSGLGVERFPPVGLAVGGNIGYRIRKGGHGIGQSDWKYYLDFADRHTGKQTK